MTKEQFTSYLQGYSEGFKDAQLDTRDVPTIPTIIINPQAFYESDEEL